MGRNGTTLCMGCKQLSSEGNRSKEYTGEVVPSGEVCLGPNHSEDGSKLNMRWMRGVFVGKLDRTDEFLLLTTTGAMKTRCVRRLEGENAWDLQFLNLCVGSPWKATARSTQQTCEKSVLATEQVRTYCRMPRLCWKWAATEECRARTEQEMVDKGDAMKIETGEEIGEEPSVSLKKRKNW